MNLNSCQLPKMFDLAILEKVSLVTFSIQLVLFACEMFTIHYYATHLDCIYLIAILLWYNKFPSSEYMFQHTWRENVYKLYIFVKNCIIKIILYMVLVETSRESKYYPTFIVVVLVGITYSIEMN